MHYLLDTNACIALLNGRPSSLVNRVRRLTSSEFGLPAPVTYELYNGAFKSRDTDRNLKLLDRIAFEVVPFDAADARAAGMVRANLEAIGRPIGPIDTLIGGSSAGAGFDPGDREHSGVRSGGGSQLRGLVDPKRMRTQ